MVARSCSAAAAVHAARAAASRCSASGSTAGCSSSGRSHTGQGSPTASPATSPATVWSRRSASRASSAARRAAWASLAAAAAVVERRHPRRQAGARVLELLGRGGERLQPVAPADRAVAGHARGFLGGERRRGLVGGPLGVAAEPGRRRRRVHRALRRLRKRRLCRRHACVQPRSAFGRVDQPSERLAVTGTGDHAGQFLVRGDERLCREVRGGAVLVAPRGGGRACALGGAAALDLGGEFALEDGRARRKRVERRGFGGRLRAPDLERAALDECALRERRRRGRVDHIGFGGGERLRGRVRVLVVQHVADGFALQRAAPWRDRARACPSARRSPSPSRVTTALRRSRGIALEEAGELALGQDDGLAEALEVQHDPLADRRVDGGHAALLGHVDPALGDEALELRRLRALARQPAGDAVGVPADAELEQHARLGLRRG